MTSINPSQIYLNSNKLLISSSSSSSTSRQNAERGPIPLNSSQNSAQRWHEALFSRGIIDQNGVLLTPQAEWPKLTKGFKKKLNELLDKPLSIPGVKKQISLREIDQRMHKVLGGIDRSSTALSGSVLRHLILEEDFLFACLEAMGVKDLDSLLKETGDHGVKLSYSDIDLRVCISKAKELGTADKRLVGVLRELECSPEITRKNPKHQAVIIKKEKKALLTRSFGPIDVAFIAESGRPYLFTTDNVTLESATGEAKLSSHPMPGLSSLQTVVDLLTRGVRLVEAEKMDDYVWARCMLEYSKGRLGQGEQETEKLLLERTMLVGSRHHDRMRHTIANHCQNRLFAEASIFHAVNSLQQHGKADSAKDEWKAITAYIKMDSRLSKQKSQPFFDAWDQLMRSEEIPYEVAMAFLQALASQHLKSGGAQVFRATHFGKKALCVQIKRAQVIIEDQEEAATSVLKNFFRTQRKLSASSSQALAKLWSTFDHCLLPLAIPGLEVREKTSVFKAMKSERVELREQAYHYVRSHGLRKPWLKEFLAKMPASDEVQRLKFLALAEVRESLGNALVLKSILALARSKKAQVQLALGNVLAELNTEGWSLDQRISLAVNCGPQKLHADFLTPKGILLLLKNQCRKEWLSSCIKKGQNFSHGQLLKLAQTKDKRLQSILNDLWPQLSAEPAFQLFRQLRTSRQKIADKIISSHQASSLVATLKDENCLELFIQHPEYPKELHCALLNRLCVDEDLCRLLFRGLGEKGQERVLLLKNQLKDAAQKGVERRIQRLALLGGQWDKVSEDSLTRAPEILKGVPKSTIQGVVAEAFKKGSEPYLKLAIELCETFSLQDRGTWAKLEALATKKPWQNFLLERAKQSKNTRFANQVKDVLLGSVLSKDPQQAMQQTWVKELTVQRFQSKEACRFWAKKYCKSIEKRLAIAAVLAKKEQDDFVVSLPKNWTSKFSSFFSLPKQVQEGLLKGREEALRLISAERFPKLWIELTEAVLKYPKGRPLLFMKSRFSEISAAWKCLAKKDEQKVPELLISLLVEIAKTGSDMAELEVLRPYVDEAAKQDLLSSGVVESYLFEAVLNPVQGYVKNPNLELQMTGCAAGLVVCWKQGTLFSAELAMKALITAWDRFYTTEQKDKFPEMLELITTSFKGCLSEENWKLFSGSSKDQWQRASAVAETINLLKKRWGADLHSLEDSYREKVFGDLRKIYLELARRLREQAVENEYGRKCKEFGTQILSENTLGSNYGYRTIHSEARPSFRNSIKQVSNLGSSNQSASSNGFVYTGNYQTIDSKSQSFSFGLFN